MAQGAREPKLTVRKDRALLVAGVLDGMYEKGEEPLEELGRLVVAAGAEVVGGVVQRIREINPKYLIGAGKIEEAGEQARRLGASVIIFDNDLTPAQGRNIERATGVRVIDRSEVILDIFASRARTRLSKNEVALAMLEYRLPRLRRMWTHLERQEGGIGMRAGPGERQIETDRRAIEKRIWDLKREIAEMHARKERAARRRTEEFFLACLVGYTNAGKSTLLNALTGAGVVADDRLFSTLDTKSAAVRLKGGRRIILSDTVGFVRRLPHRLVASFYATLDEARSADLLIHVADASSPIVRGQIAAVNGTLKEIGCGETERMLVFNKCDVPAADPVERRALKHDFPDAIWISALRGDGLNALRAEIVRRSEAGCRPMTISVPVTDGRLMSWIATHLAVDGSGIDGDRMLYRVRVPPRALEGLRKRWGDGLRILEGWSASEDGERWRSGGETGPASEW
ncbi:MAG: GTPase HflX [Planctomycetota bacterium]|nr:GTPase HflX [Planctomycetota bacterium]